MMIRHEKSVSGLGAAAVLLLGLSACDKAPAEPPPATSPPASAASVAAKSPAAPAGAPAKAADKGPQKPADLGWQKPAAWKTVNHPSRMRMATYEAPGVDGAQPAQMSVSRVGGSVDANIERWQGQFDKGAKATRSDRSVNGVKVHVVQIDGTFNGGNMPGMPKTDPQKGWSMLAAIAEANRANFFFKMTGPTKTVEAAKSDFDVLVGSIAPK